MLFCNCIKILHNNNIPKEFQLMSVDTSTTFNDLVTYTFSNMSLNRPKLYVIRLRNVMSNLKYGTCPRTTK